MKRLALLALCCAIVPDARAADRFVLGTSGIAEQRLIREAQYRGRFAAVGVELVDEIKGDTNLGALLGNGLDGHTYPSSAINDMDAGRVCNKMVAPLTRRYSSAIVGRFKTIEEARGATFLAHSYRSIAGSVMSHVLASALPPKDGKPQYVLEQATKFTAQRLQVFKSDPSIAGVHVADPQATYLARAAMLHVMVDVGDPRIPPVVASGIHVPCSYLADPAKRSVVERVAKVVHEHARWALDPANRSERIAWLKREVLGKKGGPHERSQKEVAGFAVEAMSLDEAAERLYAHDLATIPKEWPQEAVERAIHWALGPRGKPKLPLADYYERMY